MLVTGGNKGAICELWLVFAILMVPAVIFDLNKMQLVHRLEDLKGYSMILLC